MKSKTPNFLYVYSITNISLNKKYVGSKMCYKKDPYNDNYWGSSKYLNDDYKIYGKKNFKKEIIQFYDNPNIMLNGETEYILKLNTLHPHGYNRYLPDKQPKFHMAGTHNKHTELTKIKIGKKLRGISLSEETKRKIAISNTGKKRSLEVRKKYSEAKKGIKLSEEHKYKISQSEKGRIFSLEHKKLLKENNARCWKGKNFNLEHLSNLSKASKNIRRIICPHCNIEFTPWGLKRHTNKINNYVASCEE